MNTSFSYIEYLTIFTAFIYGYVATRFFSGWSAMINFRHVIKFSIDHLLWTLLTFGLFIDVWWGSWSESNSIHKNLAFYYSSLLSPLVFYIISVILFPSFSDEYFMDLKKYFEGIRKRNYLAFITLFITFQLEYYVFQDDPQMDNYYNFSAIGLSLVGYFTRSKFVHRLILGVGWTMLIAHIVIEPSIKLNSESSNFSPIEYLTIFTAFIYGFIASRFLSGWGVMISRFDQITFSKEHIAWTVLSFGLLLDMWTGSWQRENYITLNIKYFILSLSLPLVFWVLGTVTFPVIKNENQVNLKLFFHLHKKEIYLSLVLVIFCNMVVANIMEEQSWLSSENFFRLLGITSALNAAFSKEIFFERAMLAAGSIMLMIHALV